MVTDEYTNEWQMMSSNQPIVNCYFYTVLLIIRASAAPHAQVTAPSIRSTVALFLSFDLSNRI